MATTRDDAASTRDDSELVEQWRALLDCHARTTGALEKVLQERHQLGVSEFEVLERLAACDAEQTRMQGLADTVHLSQSALSRLIGRLEQDGLVMRSMCSDDRRGIYACLTTAGRERYEAARPTQRQVLSELLND
jgi:DNA-binding MarR family transcriptional regulator